MLENKIDTDAVNVELNNVIVIMANKRKIEAPKLETVIKSVLDRMIAGDLNALELKDNHPLKAFFAYDSAHSISLHMMYVNKYTTRYEKEFDVSYIRIVVGGTFHSLVKIVYLGQCFYIDGTGVYRSASLLMNKYGLEEYSTEVLTEHEILNGPVTYPMDLNRATSLYHFIDARAAAIGCDQAELEDDFITELLASLFDKDNLVPMQ